MKSIDDLGDLRGKRVIIRCDLNVPLDGDKITDDGRIRASVPTLTRLADAGAKLIVTPNTQPATIRRAVARGMRVCAGCATATEAFSALDAGAQWLKIFPSSTFGPDYIRALKAVLPPEVPVLAVGGVTPENLESWVEAGCAGAGLGSDLYRAGQAVERTRQQAERFIAAARSG